MSAFRLSSVDLRQLRIFLAVVENEGVSAAAYALGVDVTGVSRALSDLETRVGARLCQRGRAGFKLTSQGEAVYATARRYIEETVEFETALNTISRSVKGQLRIAIVDNTLFHPSSRLVEAVMGLNRRYPEVFVEVSILPPSAIEVGVRERRFELGLTAQPNHLQPLIYTEVFVEEHRLFIAKGSDLAQRLGEAPPGERALGGLPFISRSYRTPVFDAIEQQMNLRSIASANSVEAAAILVASGLGVGLLPSNYVAACMAERLTEVPCTGLPVAFPFFLVHRTDSANEPAIRLFRRLMTGEPQTRAIA